MADYNLFGADTGQSSSVDRNNATPDPFSDAFGQSYVKQDSFFNVEKFDSKLMERYKSDPSIYNDHFNPQSDNERVAYENWDKWDAISSGLGGFVENFKGAFRESAYTWPRMGKALFTLDADYLMPSEKELAQMAMDEEKMRLENPIFYAPGTEDDFLTKGFLAETIQNLGFTFGTMGELALEWGVTTAVSGALAASGAGAPAAGAVIAAEGAATGAKLGKMASVWQKMVRFFVGSAVDDAAKAGVEVATNLADDITTNATQSAIRRTVADDVVTSTLGPTVAGGTNVWDNALKIASKAPIFGEFADAARVIKAGRNGVLTGNELMKIGAGAVRRSFAEWQMAAGEASIEAGGNYGQIVTKLTDEYAQKNNGELPIGEDLQQIKNLAMQSATTDFSTNVAILAVSNKLMFGNMMRKFMPDSKVVSALRSAVMKDMAEEAGVVAIKGLSKGVPKIQGYQKGLLGTLGLTPKIASTFGVKRAAWELGKSTLKGATRFELLEGLQENLQEGTTEYLTDYYTDLYNGDLATWGKSFGEAVDSQLTKRGAKTFLMGAMTGMFVSPVVNTFQYGAATSGINPELKAHRQNVAKSIEHLNNFFNTEHENILKETVKNIKLQTAYNDGMVEALSTQDKLQYLNNRDSSLIRTVMHARRTGTMDYLSSFIKGYGENMSEKEFQEAFNYTPQELGKSSVSEVMGDISNSVKRFSDIYDKNMTKFGLYLSMDDYMKDPSAKQRFGIKKAALLDAIESVSFMEAKGQQSVTRQKEMLQRIASYASIGSSLSSSFNTIVDPDEIDNQLLLLENEIKNLSDIPQTEETKKAIETKNEEKDLLSGIKLFMYDAEAAADPNNPAKRVTLWDIRMSIKDDQRFRSIIVPVLSRYLDIKNQQAGIKTPINMQEVNDALNDILDYGALGRDHAEYVEAINLLNDPETFTAHIAKVQDARAAAFARIIYDEFQKLGEISEVGRQWLESPEQQKALDELLKISKAPSGTFENLKRIQELQAILAGKRSELEAQTAQEQKAKQEAEQKERAEKQARSDQSREYVDIVSLYENPATTHLALEFMAMRYDLDDLKNNFPFGSEDPAQRVVKRYYIGANGERVEFPRAIKVRLRSDIYPYDANHQKIMDENDEHSPVNVAIDNYDALFHYLMEYEYGLFVNQKGNEIIQNTQQTAENTAAVDTEKAKLINFVDTRVILNGTSGTLRIIDDQFILEYDNGDMILLGPVSEEASFDSFTDLSRSYVKQSPENATVVSNTVAAKVDVQESGVVTIEMSMDNLDQVIINNVTWNIERNDLGEVIGFNRTIVNKKGKQKLQRMIGEERMTEFGRKHKPNPKVEDYIRRVNAFLMMTRAIPNNVMDAATEIESLDIAIAQATEEVVSMEERKLRSDELMAQYQVNKIIRDSKTPEINSLIHQWNNSETRPNMSQEDLMKLFMWASDLRNKIKSKFTIYMGNKVLEGTMTELIQEYVNPISEIIDQDATERTKPKRATKRGAKKEERIEQLNQAVAPRKGKRGAEEPGVKPEGKKPKSRSVKTAVESVDKKAEKKASKRGKSNVQSSSVADPIQRANLGPGTRMANKITAKKLDTIQQSIAASKVTPLIEPEGTNPFDSLKEACNI